MQRLQKYLGQLWLARYVVIDFVKVLAFLQILEYVESVVRHLERIVPVLSVEVLYA